jgi:hypothetical protein
MKNLISKPLLFSLNNGGAKYYQVDKKDGFKLKKDEF